MTTKPKVTVGKLTTIALVEKEVPLVISSNVGYSIGGLVDNQIHNAIEKGEMLLDINIHFTKEEWDTMRKENIPEVMTDTTNPWHD